MAVPVLASSRSDGAADSFAKAATADTRACPATRNSSIALAFAHLAGRSKRVILLAGRAATFGYPRLDLFAACMVIRDLSMRTFALPRPARRAVGSRCGICGSCQAPSNRAAGAGAIAVTPESWRLASNFKRDHRPDMELLSELALAVSLFFPRRARA
jgi:hypothetical protein